MAETWTDNAGANLVLRDGQWVRMTEQEVETEQQGRFGAFMEGAESGLLDTVLGTLMASGAQAAGTGRTPEMAAMQGVLDEQSMQAEQAAALFPESVNMGRGTVFAGEMLGAVVPFRTAGRALSARASDLARRRADRRAVAAGENLQERTQRAGREQTLRELDQVAETLPPTPQAVSQLEASQPSRLRGLSEFMNVRRPLSPDQQKLLDSGMLDEAGFRLLPGQANGNNLFAELTDRIPTVADAFDGYKQYNAANLWARTQKAVNAPETTGRDILEASRDGVGRMFDDVEGSIQPFMLSDDVKKVLTDNTVLTPRKRKGFEFAQEQPLSGSEAMELRSILNRRLSAARRESADGVEAERMEEILEGLDDLIEANLDDPGMMQRWQDARQRYRVVLALDRPGVITPDGELSVKSFANALERQFPNEFRRRLQPSPNLPQDVQDLLKTVRASRTFMSNLPNSGTATGVAYERLLQNPASFFTDRSIVAFLKAAAGAGAVGTGVAVATD